MLKYTPNINGYSCFSIHKRIYSFMKKTDTGYFQIECTEPQMHNGDIEFMTKHDLTISRQKKLNYIKNQN